MQRRFGEKINLRDESIYCKLPNLFLLKIQDFMFDFPLSLHGLLEFLFPVSVDGERRQV